MKVKVIPIDGTLGIVSEWLGKKSGWTGDQRKNRDHRDSALFLSRLEDSWKTEHTCWHWIKPRSPGPLANTLTIMPMSRNNNNNNISYPSGKPGYDRKKAQINTSSKYLAVLVHMKG